MAIAPAPARVHVSESADVLIASRAAEDLARAMGFDEKERAEIILVVRELATNIVKHAGEGDIDLADESGTLVVQAIDRGPGMANIESALVDGYSTTGSLGYGLGTVNRLMDDMSITSRRGQGTTVSALRRPAAPEVDVGRSPLDVGVATAPKPGFDVNGDAFVITSHGHRLLVAVIDGVGHGDLAHAASGAARRYVESHADQPLDGIMRGTSRACRGTRGVVMALARVNWSRSTLEFCCIGNIETRLIEAPSVQSFFVRRGILGVRSPDARVTVQPFPPASALVMHSDGVAGHWDPGFGSQLLAMPAARAASAVLARYSRGTDDATVLVVKGAGS